MKSYLEFVTGVQAGVEQARSISATGRAEPNRSGSIVLLFSPHPDDECITGLLPLRLMRETGRQIINIPVTFGSNTQRQAGRAAELEAACGYLGWKIHTGRENFQSLELDGVARILEEFRPDIIFVPHAKDWNSRHISTHFLVVDALAKIDPAFSCLVVETEYWAAMDDPNLMVEGDAHSVADLVAATSLHAGEIARNPYHLLLPAWMQDNVRRGGELVGGQGGAVPDFAFATLYRLRKWQGREFVPALDGGISLSMATDLNELLQG